MTIVQQLRRPRIAAAAFAASVAFVWITSSSIKVAAIECSGVTEYVDTWVGEEDEDGAGEIALYARGVAESGEPCGITVRTYMQDPSGSELASAYGFGAGYATSSIVVYLNDGSSDGSYKATTEAWSQGVHYGCALSEPLVTPYASRYFYVGQDPTTGRHWHNAYACNHGCMKGARVTSSAYAPYMAETGKHVHLGPIGVCGWTSRTASPVPPACFGPPE